MSVRFPENGFLTHVYQAPRPAVGGEDGIQRKPNQMCLAQGLKACTCRRCSPPERDGIAEDRVDGGMKRELEIEGVGEPQSWHAWQLPRGDSG